MFRKAVFFSLVIMMGFSLSACESQRNSTQLVPTQVQSKPTRIHFAPIETETSTPLPTPETATATSTAVSELSPEDYYVVETMSMNKSEGNTYSQLTLEIPRIEQEQFQDVQLVSFSAGMFDNWIGGAYYLLFHKDIIVEYPVKVSLTYTEEALDLYRDRYPDFIESDLSICTHSETFNQNFLIESEFDPTENLITTEIYEFESTQFSLSIYEKYRCQAAQRLNFDSCEDQVVPEGSYLTERQYWINICHQKHAIQMEDIRICENIEELSSTQTNVVSKDICKSKVFVLSENGSVDLCRQIQEEEPLEKCIRHFAVVAEDRALCDELSSEFDRAYCYSDVAEAGSDLDRCLSIELDSARYDCIVGIALELSDPDLCTLIPDERAILQADCYSKLAKELNQPDLCEFVSPPFSEQYKEECIESAQ